MSESITNTADAVAALGALPMPVGPEPQMDADRAKAPWGRGENGRPLLPMGAHWTDVPELVNRTLDDIQARVDQAQSGHWYVSPIAELPDTVCTRVGGYHRTVGRFTNMLPADLEFVLHAHDDLSWCLEMIAKLRTQVAELEQARLRVDEVERKYTFDTAELKRQLESSRVDGQRLIRAEQRRAELEAVLSTHRKDDERTIAELRARVAEAVATVASQAQKITQLERIANAERARVAELEAGLPAMQEALLKALDRIAELEAERHSTNEALDDAVQALRTRREDAEAPYVSRLLPPRDAVCARSGCGHTGEEHHHGDTKCWAHLPKGHGDPVTVCSCAGFVAAPSVEVSADKLTALFAPTQALREDAHDGSLPHDYRASRDLPESGGA